MDRGYQACLQKELNPRDTRSMDERPEIREEKEDEDEIGEEGSEVQVRTRRSSLFVFFWCWLLGLPGIHRVRAKQLPQTLQPVPKSH